MIRRVLYLAALLGAWVGASTPARACSVCFGAGDPDASGIAWGILILLVPVLIVQLAIARFLVRAARRETLNLASAGDSSNVATASRRAAS